MANLINGNGNAAVFADQDADWFASIMGNQTSITGVGQQFEASILDAQTIGVADGVIITKEGRRIQLDADQVDTFEIPVGEQGTTNYYIIGYHLYTTDDSSQVCDTFVQLMESSSATIQEDTFRGGADEVYVSLYRVTQDGLTITDFDLLLPTIKDLTETAAEISQIKSDLTEINTVQSFTLKSATTGATYASEADISNELTVSKGAYLLVFVGRRTIQTDGMIMARWGNSFEHAIINDVNDSVCNVIEVSETSTKLKLLLYNNSSAAKTFTYNTTVCRANLVKLHG